MKTLLVLWTHSVSMMVFRLLCSSERRAKRIKKNVKTPITIDISMTTRFVGERLDDNDGGARGQVLKADGQVYLYQLAS